MTADLALRGSTYRAPALGPTPPAAVQLVARTTAHFRRTS